MPARSESGFATLFVLGICLVVLLLGSLVVDFWRVLEARRELLAIADSAAAAGANGLDAGALRNGRVAIEPTRARALVFDSLGRDPEFSGVDAAAISVREDSVTVRLSAHVHFGLAGLLVEGLDVRATGRATPHRRS